jgi:hypothetical protein
VIVEKIWMKEVLGSKLGFWKVLGSSLENCRGSGEMDLQYGESGGVKL